MSRRQVRILLVEDDAGDARRFRDMLESAAFDFELTHADRLSAALSCLQRCNVDVVLLDLSLPDSHGLQTVTRLLELAPQVPVVVLTGTNDEQLAISTVFRAFSPTTTGRPKWWDVVITPIVRPADYVSLMPGSGRRAGDLAGLIPGGLRAPV